MSRFFPAAAGLVVAVTLSGCVTASDPFDRGMALYREGNYDAAIAAFTQTINRSPGLAAAYTNRGAARVRVGDVSGALADYTYALRLTPDDADTYFNRGNAHVVAGDYVSAIADFTRAIELSPGYAKAYFNRGTARARAGDRAGALLDWHAAIDRERDPWAKAGMERSAAIEAPPAAAMPLATVTTPPQGPLAPPQPAPQAPPLPPMPAGDMDARSLANRAISREIDGDHPGAIADLSAAIGQENDPARRASMERLLQLLRSSR